MFAFLLMLYRYWKKFKELFPTGQLEGGDVTPFICDDWAAVAVEELPELDLDDLKQFIEVATPAALWAYTKWRAGTPMTIDDWKELLPLLVPVILFALSQLQSSGEAGDAPGSAQPEATGPPPQTEPGASYPATDPPGHRRPHP